MTTLTTLKELLTGPITGAEGRLFVRDLVATAPQPIPTQVLDTPGTPEAAIVWALGEGEANRSADRLAFAKAGFRSVAPVEWLRLDALELYGVTPRGEDYATTNETVTNASGAIYGPFQPGELRFMNDAVDPSAAFVNTDVVTLASSSVTTVGLIAVLPGSASTANIGEIDRLETPLEGVTCTNAQPAIGADAETADILNARIDARLGIFGLGFGFNTGGTASAFESIARNGIDNGGGVPRADGSRISVTKTRLVLDTLTGIFTLYVADEDGPLATGDLTLVRNAVQAYGEWLGAEITVANVTAVPQTVSGDLTIARSTVPDAQILEEIDAMLLGATQTAPIGGWAGVIPVKYIENAVESAGDAGKATAFVLVDVSLSSPAAAVALAANEVIILSRGTITILAAGA